jgi:hypothetical protein
MTDPDIVALRDVPPGMADSTDDSVGRTWQMITRRNARRNRAAQLVVRRWLIPVTAALAIGAIALTATLWLRGGAGSEFQPAQSATPMDVHQALTQLAAASAQAGPAQVPTADQVVHTRLDGWAASLDPSGGGQMEQQIREVWFDPQGMVALQITDGQQSFMDGLKGDRAGNIAQGRAALAAEGPSFYRATPQWLAGLPDDPDALVAVLRQTVQTNKWSQSHNIWNTMYEFSMNGDLLLSPANRAALFQAYGRLDGLTAESVVINGETFIGLRHNENGSVDEVLFDPTTGRAMAVRSLYAGEIAVSPAPGQPQLDPSMMYQAFFLQELVAKNLVP